jgi:hypothetical protein
MSALSPQQVKVKIKSSKIKKILIGTINQSIKRIWIIPNDGNSPDGIMNDVEKQLKISFSNYIIKKESSNKKIENISGTKNGRITISPDGRSNFIHIYVKNPSKKSTVEDRQVQKINDIIWNLYSSPGPIKFKIGNKNYTITNYNQNTVKQIGTKGDKSDCVISTDTGNIYISLKGDMHQQWGGVSSLSNDPNVQSFVEKLKTIKTQNSNDKSEYYTEINDNLILKSVYGKDYSPLGNSSQNNVDHILVGEGITISQTGEITANKTYNNGDIPSPRPVLISRNDKNRSDFGISNTRILVWPGVRNNSKKI